MIMRESTSNDTTPVTSYTVTLEEENDDLVLPIPEDILKKLGWEENDELEWDINEDNNSIILRKVQWPMPRSGTGDWICSSRAYTNLILLSGSVLTTKNVIMNWCGYVRMCYNIWRHYAGKSDGTSICFWFYSTTHLGNGIHCSCWH